MQHPLVNTLAAATIASLIALASTFYQTSAVDRQREASIRQAQQDRALQALDSASAGLAPLVVAGTDLMRAIWKNMRDSLNNVARPYNAPYLDPEIVFLDSAATAALQRVKRAEIELNTRMLIEGARMCATGGRRLAARYSRAIEAALAFTKQAGLSPRSLTGDRFLEFRQQYYFFAYGTADLLERGVLYDSQPAPMDTLEGGCGPFGLVRDFTQ